MPFVKVHGGDSMMMAVHATLWSDMSVQTKFLKHALSFADGRAKPAETGFRNCAAQFEGHHGPKEGGVLTLPGQASLSLKLQGLARAGGTVM